MNLERANRDNFNKTMKIPLHYQKRYFANISNGSFNVSHITGIYKNKIRNLLKNNNLLARALQNTGVKNRELMEENKANANVIMFSRLKLARLSENIKEVVTVLDETLALLEMHSSVTSSKLTPKNVLCREDFKEQVKEVLMAPIPEESASPQKISEHESNGVTHQNKELCEYQHKNHPPSKMSKSDRKTSKGVTFTNQSSVKEAKKVCMDTLNHSPISSVKNYDECSIVKMAKAGIEEHCNFNKNFASPKPTANKKRSKASNDIVSGSVKRAKKLKKSSSISKNSPQSRLHNDIQVLQKPENNINAKYVNKNGSMLCQLTNSVSSNKLQDHDTYSFSNYEKENQNSNLKKSTRNVKSLGGVELRPVVSKRNDGQNSALKNLSSRFNINSFEDGGGNHKACQIDDIITSKQKSTELMMSNKHPKTFDASGNYSQGLNLHQREIIKNLASNTCLVTAEIHKNSNLLETDKMNSQKSNCLVSKQPIVLVKDIFQSSKSLCKSILGDEEFNRASLELELLKHCSSLKVIPEESEDNSIDQTEENTQRAKLHNAEPLLSIEENVDEEHSNEEKRKLRRRRSVIDYKEKPIRTKLRR